VPTLAAAPSRWDLERSARVAGRVDEVLAPYR
jgi:hypothetical protein